VGEFSSCFGEMEDPRAGNSRYDLLEVIFIALTAVLCGAEDCTDMAIFAQAKLDVLREVMKLEHGAPSHDTFSRVFRMLKPEPFEAAFAKFTAKFSGALKGVVAIDGKAVRGAYQRGCKTCPLHLVNVWAAEARLVIGQRLAPNRNEVVGAQQALALLSLEGCIVTADALHCRADTAQIILEAGGDYALAVKANQPTLLAQAQAAVERADRAGEAIQQPAKAHDRMEARAAIVVPVVDGNFPGLAAVGRVETRCKRAGAPEPAIVRYFLLSKILTAQRMLEVARTHWTIENQLHWVLDVALGEDAARSRADHGPQNLALIRKLALNIVRQHPEKASIKGKRKRAGWNDAFLLSLLAHMR
jgi:predicted transposase YbfD/YdcC